MTTSNDLDTVSHSWNEHSEHSGLPSQAQIQVAEAASTQKAAPAAAEPVPVDVGSGAPVKPEAPAEAKTPAAAAPHEYVADANHVVKLPANVTIDNIKVDGHNLVLEQADGSVIVIKDGALNVPTFLIGDVEVPRVALIAALEASHVDVAFGADGSISAGPGGSTSSAGGDFSVPPGGIGDGFGLSALLPPTDLAFGQPDHRELFPSLIKPNSIPSIIDLTPSVDGGDTIVNEKGLPASSGSEGSGEAQNPAPNSDQSEINTGTFTITSPDGVASLTIAGQVISGAALANSASTPIEITTPLGNTLTINGYDASTGQVSYSYTLVHSAAHPDPGTDSIFDNMTVTVTDTDGDISAPGTLSVQIVDDVPTANADANSVGAGSHTQISGNVITGVGETDPSASADVKGADGASVTSAFGTGAAQDVTSAVTGTTIAGQYGTLTLYSDGHYTYDRATNTPGGVNDVFHYTLTDGDGDQSNTTLTINIGNEPPTLGDIPAAGAAGAIVYEAGLPSGSQHDGSNAVSGTVGFTSQDGVNSVSLGGHALSSDSGNPTTFTDATTGGTVSAWYEYTSATGTGTIHYSYTLTADYHSATAGDGANTEAAPSFAVVVTDLDNQPASGNLVINVIDDVPTAKADTDAAQSGETVTGNVETGASTHGTGAADTAGADGIASIAWTGSVTSNGVTTVTGAHGVLTVFADGDYSYHANPNTTTGNDVFNYTITDGDGDTSPATLTITVANGQPQVSPAAAAVDEAGLDTTPPAGDLGLGTVNGSHAGDGSETTTGTLTFSDPDGATVTGVASGNVGSDVSGNVGTNINGTYGILHVNTDGTYTYTLTNPEANVPAGNDGTNVQPGQDVFTYTVKDSFGNTSTSTITISIKDDVPTAHNDTDAAQSGETVTGNVETGTSTHGTGAVDTAGADGIASIAWTGSVTSNGVTTVTGAHGVLTVFANGDYSYQATPNTPTGNEVFNYTITDGDGDTSPATLTIDVTGSQPRVVAEIATVNEAGLDTTPPAGDLGPGTVDGSHAGDGTETKTGTLTFSDPDGATVTGVASGDVGSDVSGNVGTNINGTYGILHVNADGTYTYTLTSPEANVPAGNDGANVQPGQDVFTFTVTDSLGNTSTSTISINIQDDVPSITLSGTAAPTLNVDESYLAGGSHTGAAGSTTDTESFAGAFTVVQGADGATTSYGVSLSGSASNLVDSATGLAVVLTQSGNTVSGYVTGHSGDPAFLVFTLSVNTATGDVTLTQDRAIHQNTADNPTDSSEGINLTSGLVTLTATVTDNDGDKASQSLDLGSKATFHDDGPSITLSGTAAPTLNVDESYLAGGSHTGAAGSTTDTESFAGAFTVVQGADGATTSYGVSLSGSASNLVDSATGLAVVLTQSGNTVSGYVTGHSGDPAFLVFTLSVNTATGDVTLTQDRAIHQNTADNPTDSSEGINLTSGLVTLTATVTDNDGDKASQSLDLGSKATFHDDGPSITLSGTAAPTLNVDESYLAGGSHTGAAGSTTDTESFAGAFTVVQGADGATTSYGVSLSGSASNLVDSATGLAVVLTQSGNTVSGYVTGHSGDPAFLVFTLSVNTATGDVTLTQDRAIHQNTADNPTDSSEGINLTSGLVTLTATVTDNDGDKASQSLDLGSKATFHDDGPSITLSGTAAPTLNVDESYLAGGSHTGAAGSTTDTESFAGAFTVVQGADGATTSYGVSLSGSASNLVDSATGLAVVLTQSGNTVSGYVTGHSGDPAFLVFTLSVNTATGDVTLTQDRAIHQNTADNPTDSSEGINLTSGLVTLTATVTDNDGDKASQSLDLGSKATFHDDGPSITLSGTAAPTLNVDESYLAGGSHTGAAGSTTDTESFAGAFTVVQGADGATTSYGVSLSGSASNLVDSATGLAVVLTQSGNTVSGYVTGHSGDPAFLVFTLSVNTATGDVTLTQDRAIHQNTADNPTDSSEGINLTSGLVTLTATVTDNDGDKASQSLDLGSKATFHDDGPSITLSGTAAPTLNVDESYLAGGSHTGAAGSTTDTESFAGAFTVVQGADGATTSYGVSLSGSASNLVDSATGLAVVLTQSGNTVSGYVTGHSGDPAFLVFTLSVNTATGDVTLTQDRAIHQNTADNPTDSSEGINLTSGLVTLTATVTDNDGDKASQSLDLGSKATFHDDGPSITLSGTAAPTLNVDESYLAGGSHTGAAGSTTDTESFAGAFTVVQGADGATTSYGVSLSGSASNLVDSATGLAVVLTQSGNTVSGYVTGHSGDPAFLVFTLSVNTATGDVTLTQDRAIHQNTADNPTDSSEGINLTSGLVTLTATVTDNDGDKASQSLDLGSKATFHDDGPSITLSGTAAPTLNVDESYLANGSTPNAALTAATAAFAGMFTVVQGADGATTSYGLSVSAQGVTSNLIDSATNTAVVLTQSGSTVSGYVSGHSGDPAFLVFTLSTNAATGDVTLTEFRAVHENTVDNPTDSSEGISLTSGLVTLTATVTDNDGDKASQSLDLGSKATFHDDGPSLGSFTSGTIPNEVGSVAGFFSLVPGADGIDHFNITGPAIAGIVYSTTTAADGATTLHANAGATEVFDLTVRSDGTYEFDLLKPDAGTTITYALQNLPAGGPNWRETTDGHIEFSSPAGINSNNNGFGVGNTFVGGNETFTMEFHTSGTGVGTDDPASTNAELNDSVSLVVNSLNGAGGTYHWVATNTLTNTSTSGDISITSTGTFVIDPSISFNQLQVSAVNVSGQGAQFSNISITHNVLPQDQNLAFTVSATDKDGDTTGTQALGVHVVAADGSGNYALTGTAGNDVLAGSTHADTISGGAGTDIVDYTGSVAAISIHLADDGHASGAPADPNNPSAGTIGGGDAAGDTLTGIEGLIGGSGDDHLFGNALANYLAGGAGNDTLNGGGGNDILVGGAGQDTLTGGTGADTFKLDHLDIKDLITDYSGVGGDGDKIDLTALFDTAPAGNISNYVHYNSGTGALSVDTSGSGNPANFVDVAQLTNAPVAGTITILYDDNTHAQHTATI